MKSAQLNPGSPFSEIFFSVLTSVEQVLEPLVGMYNIMMIKMQNLKVFEKNFFFVVGGSDGGSTFEKNHLFFRRFFTLSGILFPSGSLEL